MTGYFTGKVEAGKIYTCKTCGNVPTIGQDRYYEKKGDNWIGCTDLECFKKQGGSAEPAQKKGGFTSNKFKITDAPEIAELAKQMQIAYIKENIALNNQENIATKTTLFESLFKTLSSSYKK